MDTGCPKIRLISELKGLRSKEDPVAAQVSDMLDILEADGAGDTEGKSIQRTLSWIVILLSGRHRWIGLSGWSEAASLGRHGE